MVASFGRVSDTALFRGNPLWDKVFIRNITTLLLTVLAVIKCKSVLLWKKTFTWTFVLHATHFIRVSKNLLIRVVASIALTSVSVHLNLSNLPCCNRLLATSKKYFLCISRYKKHLIQVLFCLSREAGKPLRLKLMLCAVNHTRVEQGALHNI